MGLSYYKMFYRYFLEIASPQLALLDVGTYGLWCKLYFIYRVLKIYYVHLFLSFFQTIPIFHDIFENLTTMHSFLSLFYILYARHYNRFVYFLPTFKRPFLCFQRVFFRKFCPYAWLVFKSDF